MAFQPTFVVVNSAGVDQALVDSWQAIAVEALKRWGAVLAGDAPALVRLEILDSVPSGRGDGGSGSTIRTGAPDGGVAWESAAAGELRAGTNLNAQIPDYVIRMQKSYFVDELFLDTTFDTSSDIPATRTDGLSVMMHEIGHALGMGGYWIQETNTFPRGDKTPYDTRMQLVNGSPFFFGPNTQAVFGAPVPLTNGNYSHYGNISKPPTPGELLTGLMNGVNFYRGVRYEISDLELAFMADVGLGTIRDDIFDQTWMSILRGGAGTDLFRGDYSTLTTAITINAANPAQVAAPNNQQLFDIERFDLKLGSGADSFTGGAFADSVDGGAGNDVLIGNGGADILKGGAGDDQLNGGEGLDVIDGGEGRDAAIYSGAFANFAVSVSNGVWTVRDTRPSGPSEALAAVEELKFDDRTLAIVNPLPAATATAFFNILQTSFEANFVLANDIADQMKSGAWTPERAVQEMIKIADASTSVATLAYQFFTGKIPSAAGLEYLVSPTGPNANNINSAYYQSFTLENRYINFSVNLGKLGEGKDAFAAAYSAKSLTEATKDAYTKIFGTAPTDAKVSALLDPTFVLNGLTLSRAEYFAYYGQDGRDGIGTKAAMVGWLLSEAVKADLGVYAKANDAFLLNLSDGADFSIDLLGVYAKPEFVFVG